MLSVFGDKTKIVPNYKAINILHNKVIMQLQLTNIWWLCVIYLTLDRTMRTAPWLAAQAMASNKNAAITQIVLPSCTTNSTQQRHNPRSSWSPWREHLYLSSRLKQLEIVILLSSPGPSPSHCPNRTLSQIKVSQKKKKRRIWT